MFLLDGEWSNWSEWDNCTVECGGGNQTRTRTCTNPEPSNGSGCSGEDTEIQICNDEPCGGGNFQILKLKFFVISFSLKI